MDIDKDILMEINIVRKLFVDVQSNRKRHKEISMISLSISIFFPYPDIALDWTCFTLFAEQLGLLQVRQWTQSA